MEKKRYLLLAVCFLLLGSATTVRAQRTMDKLSRGLVATIAQSGKGNFVSWRVLGEEYYDVTYNLYADGSLIAKNLTVSNYEHSEGTTTTQYSVAPVVKGVEGEKCAAVTRFAESSYYSLTKFYTGFLKITGATMTSRTGADITANYEFNDVVLADLDGDGMPEIIAKRLYTGSPGVSDATNTSAYNRIEAYNVGGNRLWSIDIGPNMQSGADEQFDAVAFDWDGDGKAEVLMRGADNMIIHHPDGTTTEIGDMTHDIRKTNNTEYSMPKNEYLLYMEGATAKPYVIGDNGEQWMDYPAKRLESGETSWSDAWGDGSGHRATKHYFGAPYLDGKKPSIFIGRGCYTRHKFYAFDVDPLTHRLTERWHWLNNTDGAWKGQGYHNFAVADVDMDGRDEIVFGSMVIDDNGLGLSTTGLGHGDAQHCGDLDPYRFGLEQFACNESSPAMNYRNATTSELYYRMKSTGDDGRALAGNFYNDYPGSQGQSSQTSVLSLTADKELPDASGWDLAFRIYWDGDLCDEVLNSPGTARQPKIDKPGYGRIFLGDGNMNNWSKNNPCATGDLFGDWREELLVRYGNDLLIYTSNYPTDYRIPTLWHDHQYRQGMVWETIGYNQPPHTSYFLGELEGITIAPPPLTTEGRTIVNNGGTISSALNGKQVLVYDNADNEVTIEAGAHPWVAVFNAPSWVQGTAASECTATKPTINYNYYTCTVKGGGFSGATRIVKQGEGTLILPDVEMTHSGNTDVWNGTLTFNGTMKNSPLWLNRHTALNSTGTFRSIKADYNATIRPGGESNIGTITTDSLCLGFGSRIVFDLGSDLTADRIDAKYLSIETKSWTYGPKYLNPVFEFNVTDLQTGKYPIISVAELNGDLSSITIEGVSSERSAKLVQEDGTVYLEIGDIRNATNIVWTGASSDTWDFAQSPNFTTKDSQEATIFVTNDNVTFDDTAVKKDVTLSGSLEADSVIVDNTDGYTFNGTGSIAGATTLVKRGSGKLTINTDNTYTGGTRISGGTVVVSLLSNENRTYGALGAVTKTAPDFIIENGATLRTTGIVTQGSPMRMEGDNGGCIENIKDFVVNKPISGTMLTKKSSGWMKLNTNNSALTRLKIAGGTVQCVACTTPAKTVEFVTGTLNENAGSSYAIEVPKAGQGTWSLVNNATYSNKVTGEGTLTIYCPVIHGSSWYATRTHIAINLSGFTGTIMATADTEDTTPRFTLDTNSGMPNGTLNIASGVTVQNTGKTFHVGTLAGTGALGGYASFANNGATGTNTWKAGTENDFFWGGKVTSNSKFDKVGSGKMTVSGVWDNTGAVTVTEGNLNLRSGSSLGTGSLTIQSGGTLSGTTTLSNSSVTVNGTIQPGLTYGSTSGIIKFGDKNVTVNESGTLIFNIRGAATTYSTGGPSLQGINRMQMNGHVHLNLKEGVDWEVGDSIVLWKATTNTGTPILDNNVVDSTKALVWDETDLYRGILRVVKSTDGISDIHSDSNSTQNAIYDLAGRKVGNTTEGLAPGVYVRNGRKFVVR